ncbi:EAL domain-containing protein [uncultured Roseibium sp.]|uniref:putative bifunctional diguanylate cyclase/phosphodiesterase n=1 Tax=uncultured Roseibium sp. TaxID=1936171 RepID=UPI00259454D2|nr:EAL domain-containing protein [uncultured Roseibium sp.]
MSALARSVWEWVPGLRTRFVLLVSGLFLVLTAVMIVVVSYLDLRDEENRIVEHVRSVGATVSRLAVPHLVNHHYLILEQELQSIAGSGIVDVAQVYDPGREITVDSDPATSYFDDIEIDALIREALSTGAETSRVTQTLVTMAFPVRRVDGTDLLGAVLVSAPRPEAAGVIWTIWQRNAITALVLLGFCMPVAFHFGSGFLRPIKSLTRTAHSVSAGDFDAPFPVDRRDEIGVLARAYRDMIARIRENLDQIHRLAYVDTVTGLPNREFFRQHCLKKMELAAQRKQRLAVLFIDLDRFKRVNDSYGHDSGDRLLKEIGERFRAAAGAADNYTEQAFSGQDRTDGTDESVILPTVARLGGDEFAVMYPVTDPRRDVAVVASRLIEAAERPCEVNGLALTVGASLGVSVFPDDGTDYTAILKNADIAMYAAKKVGGNALRFYADVENTMHARERLQIEADLRRALLEDQITVFYQPKVDCNSGSVVGAEALARWNHPTRGLLSPGYFIDVAEETGLIIGLGEIVLRMACRQGKTWLDEGCGMPLAVNVSVRQLEQPGFTDQVLQILKETGFPADQLELEVTETVAMANPEITQSTTQPLREAGVRFAIDDFGTGYSSLAYLQKLPFDTFKIDRSFIWGLGSEDSNRLIVQTILAMAQSLNFDVVAEGVETVEQQQFLRDNGCATAQGYLFSAPMAADVFAKWRDDFSCSHCVPGTCGPAAKGNNSTQAA